jgi:ABC-type transport system involved in cytochrome bd biosynthesis fused ATPase/permease subunit
MLSEPMKDARVYKPVMGSPFSDSDAEGNGLRGATKPTNAIELENARVLPGAKATLAAISNTSFTIERGFLTLLLDPISCRKMTLLKAMLGELPYSSGSIYFISQKMSNCSQTPRPLNNPIRDSICGLANLQFDETWYGTVVEARTLHEDIRQWPEGDKTIIGSKGLTLSGVQKQRVVRYS